MPLNRYCMASRYPLHRNISTGWFSSVEIGKFVTGVSAVIFRPACNRRRPSFPIRQRREPLNSSFYHAVSCGRCQTYTRLVCSKPPKPLLRVLVSCLANAPPLLSSLFELLDPRFSWVRPSLSQLIEPRCIRLLCLVLIPNFCYLCYCEHEHRCGR